MEASLRATGGHLVEAGWSGLSRLQHLDGSWDALVEDLKALEDR